jgi:hypothetical protein
MTEMRHHESAGRVYGSPADVFEFLDDHRRLSAHMTRASWMLAGSRMTIELDTQEGRALGSRISLGGRVLRIPLEVAEVVVEYAPPLSKRWRTVGSPKLLVIGSYEMGFTLTPGETDATTLRVFIDYTLPSHGIPRFLGMLFSGVYARWCTTRMARDAAIRFPPGSPVL